MKDVEFDEEGTEARYQVRRPRRSKASADSIIFRLFMKITHNRGEAEHAMASTTIALFLVAILIFIWSVLPTGSFDGYDYQQEIQKLPPRAQKLLNS
jgi:hypothetical protein